MKDNTIGQNLVYQRKLKGYSQQQLSEKTEVTIRTIQRIEKGEVQPHLQTIRLLAAALDIDSGQLMPLENPKEEAVKKKWLLLLHGTPLLGFVLPFCNVLFPLFLWIHKREDNPLYDQHGIRVVNFQITALLLYILSFVALLTVEKWGFILFISVIPLCTLIILVNIIYAVKEHKCYYPLAIPFLKFKSRPATGIIILLLSLLNVMHVSSQNGLVERLDGSTIPADSISARVEQLMDGAGVQGLVLTLFNDHRIAYAKTFGYKDYQEQFPLRERTNIYGASLSKAVFSILVMQMVEEGLIDLDTPLESYLPKKIHQYKPQTRWHDDLSALKTDSLYHKITARMCLSHTTGFANWRWDEPDHKLRVHREPGTAYGYSGEGFVYLQLILEKLTGKGLEDLAEERLFRPLGMKNSSYQWQSGFEGDFSYGHNKEGMKYSKDTDNEPRAGSTLETTAEDYGLFLQAVLQQKLLSEASYKELFSPQIRLRSLTQFGEGSKVRTQRYDSLKLGYALGWGYLETPYGKGVFKEGHGNGFQHYSILFPDTGKGLLIMANSDNGESIFKALLEVALKDIFTPWEWQGYIPYNQK